MVWLGHPLRMQRASEPAGQGADGRDPSGPLDWRSQPTKGCDPNADLDGPGTGYCKHAVLVDVIGRYERQAYK